MQTLCQVTNCVPPHRQILDEAKYPSAVLNGDALLCGEILFQERSGNFVPKVLVTGEGHEDASGDILCEARDLIRKLRHVVLAHIRHEHVGQEVPGWRRSATERGCHGCARNVLVQVSDLNDFVLDVGRLLSALVLADGGRGAEQHVAEPRLTDVRPPVIGSETLHEHPCEVNLSVHEHHAGWNHHVLEEDRGLLPAELCVSLVDLATLHGSEVAALPAVHVGQARRVNGDRASNGVVPVGLVHLATRHNNHPMRIDCAGLVHLRSTQHDTTVRQPLSDPHEKVRIVLLRRRPRAVAFGVCHRAADDEVVLLHLAHEAGEALMVVCAVALINVVRRGPDRVDRIHANTALEARARAAAELPLHLRLEHEVRGGLGHVQEAACAHPTDADRGPELWPLLRQAVSFCHRVHGRPNDRVVHRLFNELAEKVHPELAPPQGLQVLVCCSNPRQPCLRARAGLPAARRHGAGNSACSWLQTVPGHLQRACHGVSTVAAAIASSATRALVRPCAPRKFLDINWR
mmetsp:Transcript_97447/g.275647  ORF Transcript_97447/g.275647 Transcript_97447/m.275647 type:complete len:518 (-) Transcript_97447:150-1703(-)